MRITVESHNMVLFQMWSNKSHVKPYIKEKLDELLIKIRTILTKETEVKSALDKLLPSLFNFRIDAIKWLSKENGLNFPRAVDQVYLGLEKVKGNPGLEILIENILFCLRCNKRVVETMMKSGGLSKAVLKTTPTELPTATYTQVLSTLALSLPNNEIAQKLTNWINSSLYIEFTILSVLLITTEKLNITNKIVDELASIAADAAQEYTAIALESGIIKKNIKNSPAIMSQFDEKFVQEQKYIADLGMNDFAKNF